MKRRHAYTAVINPRGPNGSPNGYGIGRADEGTGGYTPVRHYGPFETYERAKSYADHLNAMLNLSKLEAFEIVADTMTRPVTRRTP